jgi:hypothetical protein
MSYKNVDEVLQWVGTAFILVMYALMNFFPEFRVYTIVTGLGGAVCFFAWAYRVANKQQMIINGVAITLCVIGLYKAWG